MSYNVTAWKTKELVDLRISLASLTTEPRKDWRPGRTNHDDGEVTFFLIDSSVTGRIEGEWLHVASIDCSGEGSGVALNLVFEPALEHSTGRLVAVRVWEGGEHIDRLIVQDGKVTTERIEL